MCLLFCTRSTECIKPCVHIPPINCHTTPQKDILIPYMVQALHPLNIGAFAILFPFATTPAALYYFSNHSVDWLFSPQHGRLPISFYFINYFPHLTIPTDYPPFLFSSHSPHSRTLYLLPAIECYPLGLTNILYCLASDYCCFFWIRSLIQLPFHHSLTWPSTLQSISPTHHLVIILSTNPSSQLFSQFRQHQGPNEWGSLVRTDTFFIFPCFLETWTEKNALTITDSSLLRLTISSPWRWYLWSEWQTVNSIPSHTLNPTITTSLDPYSVIST